MIEYSKYKILEAFMNRDEIINEYEKKINRAKNEVKVLEAKLKILNGQ